MKLLRYGTRGSEKPGLLHQGITGREFRAVVGLVSLAGITYVTPTCHGLRPW